MSCHSKEAFQDHVGSHITYPTLHHSLLIIPTLPPDEVIWEKNIGVGEETSE